MSFNGFENNMLNQVAFILKKAQNISPKTDMFKKNINNIYEELFSKTR